MTLALLVLPTLLGKMNNDITIVSGFPRSGTSMMMQILERGGIPPLCDSPMKVNENNPRGFYEYEKTQSLSKDSSWMSDARGKALKVIVFNIKNLPKDHSYRVIFMTRKVGEIIASTIRMNVRNGHCDILKRSSPLKNPRWYESHLDSFMVWSSAQVNMKVMYCDYNQVISNPVRAISKVKDFLGLTAKVNDMSLALDLGLYREKA